MAFSIRTQFNFNDRGLCYGDGFFTTVCVTNGKIELWHLHRQRLEECQQRLGFPTLPMQAIECEVKALAKDQDSAVVKVIVTRGEGGRGYAPPEDAQVNINVSRSSFPSHYEHWRRYGIELELSNIQLANQPILAGLKTLNRLEQVLIKQDAVSMQCDDVVVCDANGQVVEASAANIIYFENGNIYTPDLSSAGINGVYLQALRNSVNIQDTTINFEALLGVDALFLCNSLMGLVPVKRLASRYFDITNSLALKSKHLRNAN